MSWWRGIRRVVSRRGRRVVKRVVRRVVSMAVGNMVGGIGCWVVEVRWDGIGRGGKECVLGV